VYRIEPMTQEDVPEVSRVERRCFSNPWPVSAYRRELQAPEQNHYVVLREVAPYGLPPDHAPNGSAPPDRSAANGRGSARQLPRRTLLPLAFGRRHEADGSTAARLGRPPVLGFAGMWVVYDEAHVTTIGVEPTHRGRGLGELLLVAMFDEALRRGAQWLTLEVRVSNEPAQALYRKYGFNVQGTRKRYYSDNHEDAHVMWSRSLHDPAYRAELAALRASLLARLEPAATSYQLSAADDRRAPAG
jgi:ribosomal-protein-alanine N-acetyltransferase